MTGVRTRVRSRRVLLPAVVVLLVLAAAVVGALGGPDSDVRLDPTSSGPQGARAIAEVLRAHGVRVEVREDLADVRQIVDENPPGGTTVALTRSDLLGPGAGSALADLAEDAGLVVADADNGLLTDLDLPVGAVDAGGRSHALAADCDEPLAALAGPVLSGGTAYHPDPELASRYDVTSSAGCYPSDRGALAYLRVELRGASSAGNSVTLLSGDLLTNDALDREGDAALAVGALGRRPVLVWWTPDPLTSAVSPSDGGPGGGPDGRPSLGDLLPRGIPFAALQLLVVLLVVVVWRSRRLGRLVSEPLPVVVRAIETTLGRGQLYRRARARDRAAQVLRVASTRRLARRCGLPVTADPDEVADAVSAATGRPVEQVRDLLTGPDPADETALVALAQDVQALEREVQNP